MYFDDVRALDGERADGGCGGEEFESEWDVGDCAV